MADHNHRYPFLQAQRHPLDWSTYLFLDSASASIPYSGKIFVGGNFREFRELQASGEYFLRENCVMLVWSLGFAQFSKKIFAKSYLEAICKNFLPRKFPAILNEARNEPNLLRWRRWISCLYTYSSTWLCSLVLQDSGQKWKSLQFCRFSTYKFDRI